MQRFRGRTYVSEGNLKASELSYDGRHIQVVDWRSWHLLTLDEQGSVAACGRLAVQRRKADFGDLLVSRTALATSERWGHLLRQAVEQQICSTWLRGMHFGELGGWAVSKELRCSTEAVRLVLAGYALGRILGGVGGISTVNTGHHSSAILRRMGGVPLTTGETPFPPFYEPHYRAELEILCLDSSRPNARYETQIRQCQNSLQTVMVISSISATDHHAAHRLSFFTHNTAKAMA